MRIIAFAIALLSVLFFSFSPISVSTQKTLDDAAATLNVVAAPTGVPTVGIQTQVGTIIRVVLSIVGTVFFVLMIYGGFRWMGARGNEEQIAQAKNTIIAAVIGVVIVLAAYAVTVFVTDRLL